MEQAGPTSTCGGLKFRRDILGARAPQQAPPVQGSSVWKISPHNFWLQKPAGTESVEETSGVPSSST